MRISKDVRTTTALGVTFAFLADFTTTERWDPGTIATQRLDGDGGVGTRYLNTSRFRGRTTQLVYEVTDHRPDALIALRGENSTLTAHDTMAFTALPDGGTQVHYEARFRLKGWARLAAPFLRPAFRQLGRDASVSMREVLDRLAVD